MPGVQNVKKIVRCNNQDGGAIGPSVREQLLVIVTRRIYFTFKNHGGDGPDPFGNRCH